MDEKSIKSTGKDANQFLGTEPVGELMRQYALLPRLQDIS